MSRHHLTTLCSILLIVLAGMLFGVVLPAQAADQISIEDLQAAMQTLNFLDSLPKEGTIVVGVIYSSETANAQAMAMEAVKTISAMRGPKSRSIQAVALSTYDLSGFAGHLDLIVLLSGASKHAEIIQSAMRRLRVESISDDPDCLPTNCCVLFVQAGRRVEITLNSALADAVGAHFSLVFMMVVKRK
jgi:hypothetical protein